MAYLGMLKEKNNIEIHFQKTSEQEIIKEKIAARDHFDSNRKHSPLKPADDAFIIDTSDLTIEQVVALITKRIRGNV